PVRQRYDIDGAQSGKTLLTMPAWQANGAVGVKLVTVFADNAIRSLPAVHSCYVLFDAESGAVRAILDGHELTLRRTGAASALATKYLARPDARRLLMVGTGELAPHLVLSHAEVRPIEEVLIWGRRAEKARETAAALQGHHFAVDVCTDLESGVARADIISCATLSQDPLIEGRWLRPGQHLDLVGAFRPNMREVDDTAMKRAELYVDTRAGALAEAGEFVQAIANGAIKPDDVRGELSQLARGTIRGRSDPQAITLFKSVGTAIEDLAAAELATEAAGTASNKGV
ncbi:MAG TPA: ornithine cyclodeaminase family protein, partial [Steroidobacteraceae bacterium]|nr:ornithine cyclodeaminase family protein [Steroidobacteraceae bacterium]